MAVNQPDDTPEPSRDSAREAGSRIGALLRTTREDLGEDLPDVADALRIRESYLEAIEEGRFDELPGTPYAVGFVRSYADYLGLDGEEMVRRFKAEVADIDRGSELVFPEPEGEGRVPGGAVLLIAVLLLGVAYGGWYLLSAPGTGGALVPAVPERITSLLDGGGPPADKAPRTGAATEGEPETDKTAAEETAADKTAADKTGDTEETGTTDTASATQQGGADTDGGAEDTATADAGAADGDGQTGDAADDADDAEGEQAVAATGSATPDQPGTQQAEDGAGPAAPDGDAADDARMLPSGTEDMGHTAAERRMVTLPLPPQPPPESVRRRAAADFAERGITQSGAEQETPQDESAGTQQADATDDGMLPGAPEADTAPDAPDAPDGDTDGTPPASPETETAATDATSEGAGGDAQQQAAETADGDTAGAAGEADTADAGQDAAAGDAGGTEGPDGGDTTETAGTPDAGDDGPPAAPGLGEDTDGNVYGAKNKDVRVVLKATSDSWVQVRDARNRLLLTRLLRPGDVYRVPPGKEGLTLLTGNAGGLKIVVDGETAPRLGGQGKVMRGVPLDPQKLLSGDVGNG